MPLTPEEQQELEQLKAEEASLGLSPEVQEGQELSSEEAAELQQLKSEELESVGGVESFARGAAQDATFGFSDEIVGAAEAGAELLTGETSIDEFQESYVKHRDESREANKLAETANPTAYLAGGLSTMVIGGLGKAGIKGAGFAAKKLAQAVTKSAPGSAKTLGKMIPHLRNTLPGASKLKASVIDEAAEQAAGGVKAIVAAGGLKHHLKKYANGATQGAGLGAVAGVGYSDVEATDLLQGDFHNLAEFGTDALMGAGIGAVVGGGLPATLDAGGAALKGAIALPGKAARGVGAAVKAVKGVSLPEKLETEMLDRVRMEGATELDPTKAKIWQLMAKPINAIDIKLTGNVIMDNIRMGLKAGLDMSSDFAGRTAKTFKARVPQIVKERTERELAETGTWLDGTIVTLDDKIADAGGLDLSSHFQTAMEQTKELAGIGSFGDTKRKLDQVLKQLTTFMEQEGMSVTNLNLSEARGLNKEIRKQFFDVDVFGKDPDAKAILEQLSIGFKENLQATGDKLIGDKSFSQAFNKEHNLLNALDSNPSWLDLFSVHAKQETTDAAKRLEKWEQSLLDAENISPTEHQAGLTSKLMRDIAAESELPLNFIKAHATNTGATPVTPAAFFRVRAATKAVADLGMGAQLASGLAVLGGGAGGKFVAKASRFLQKPVQLASKKTQMLREGTLKLQRSIEGIKNDPDLYIQAAYQVDANLGRRLLQSIQEEDKVEMQTMLSTLINRAPNMFGSGRGMLNEQGQEMFTSPQDQEAARAQNRGNRHTQTRMRNGEMIEQGLYPPNEPPVQEQKRQLIPRPRDANGRKRRDY